MSRPRLATVLIFLVAFLISAIILIQQTEAATFSISYDITFTFQNNRSAKVTQKVSLKNLAARRYPGEYYLNISSTQVSNLSGKDSLGAIKVTSKKAKDSTIITAKLNDKIIGKNKETVFTVNYTIENLSNKNGRMWDILVPGVDISEKLRSFKLTLKIPKSYGDIYSIYPAPLKIKSSKDFKFLAFDKKKDPDETIVGSFGDYQAVNFYFKFKLNNPNFFSKKERILVPRDTSFQEVYFSEINPRPKLIDTDQDGNYFAEYELGPGEEKEIAVKGAAKIDKKMSEKLSSLEKEFELGDSKFWEVGSSQISKVSNSTSDISSVYKFVTQTLIFDEVGSDKNINKRQGAQASVVNPDKALTSEFVDLFITLARAKKIPTRQVVGFAFGDGTSLTPILINGEGGNKNLHTWVEYFDEKEKIWKQADPTWGATRGVNYLHQFDANHLTLFIRNSSSEKPKVPKIFALEGSSAFKIEPSVADFNFPVNPSLEIDLKEAVSGFPSTGKIIIKNDSGKALRGAKVMITTQYLNILGEDSRDLGTIMPFSQYTVNLKVRGGSLFKTHKGKIVVDLVGLDQGVEKSFSSSKEVLVEPFFSFNAPQVVLLVILAAVLANFTPAFYRRLKKPS